MDRNELERQLEFLRANIGNYANEWNEHEKFQWDQELIAGIAEILSLLQGEQPVSLFDYWGPRGVVKQSPSSPGQDYYRLVPETADDVEGEIAASLSAGEPPVVYPGPDLLNNPQLMRGLEGIREHQWESENRAFARTPQGGFIQIRQGTTPQPLTKRPYTDFVPITDNEAKGLSGLQRFLESIIQE